MAKMNIKKGDKVLVLSGKDKGVESTVTRAIPSSRKVIVEKVNVVKKAQKPSQVNPQGGIISKEAPIDVSNVQLICPSCKKATRVAISFEDGKKVRVCKKCGKTIA